jgi:AraC family transcriptional regulator, regulatory protein of adaptative response / DNA-3-methyladenine glycosylase II
MIQLSLNYTPPIAWQSMLNFWRARTLTGIDWVRDGSYGRTFYHQQQPGWFEVSELNANQLQLKVRLATDTDRQGLILKIRRLLDLDVDIQQVELCLSQHSLFSQGYIPGLRIPGVWDTWEAGVRAILGQQVSIAGARTQLNRLVQALGVPLDDTERLFPTPQAVLASNLEMIKVPQLRRSSLTALAALLVEQPFAAPEQWLNIKGIGPWSVNYAKLRGLSETDIWLAGDLGIKKALQQTTPAAVNDLNLLAPWRSYATLQLWFSLGA